MTGAYRVPRFATGIVFSTGSATMGAVQGCHVQKAGGSEGEIPGW